MMLDPGCKGGRRISENPAWGPLFISRRSFAIFSSDEAEVFRHPLNSAAASMDACAKKWLSVSTNDNPVRSASFAAILFPNPG
jgi:hypothetical protein